MHDQIVYLNGKLVPMSEATVPVLDRGFIFGDGIYDVIPVYGRKMFRPHHPPRAPDAQLASSRHFRRKSRRPSSSWLTRS